LRLAEGFVEVRPLGPIPVKGFPDPIAVFELVGSGAAHSRLEVGAARGLSRLVGREAELDVVRQALESGAHGRGQLLALVGEAGVGKSRLVREAAGGALAAGWMVLQASALSYGASTPYQAVADLLRKYFAIEPRDERDVARRRVAEGLFSL